MVRIVKLAGPGGRTRLKDRAVTEEGPTHLFLNTALWAFAFTLANLAAGRPPTHEVFNYDCLTCISFNGLQKIAVPDVIIHVVVVASLFLGLAF